VRKASREVNGAAVVKKFSTPITARTGPGSIDKWNWVLGDHAKHPSEGD